jgi:hypothetical protein
LAQSARIASSASTRELIHSINTRRAVLARIGSTFINVRRTTSALKTRKTCAREGIQTIRANATIETRRWIAIINIVTAECFVVAQSTEKKDKKTINEHRTQREEVVRRANQLQTKPLTESTQVAPF